MPPYDPDLRRDTPLARKLIARIRAHGPMGMDQYMDACLNDPEFGYYRTRVAIGRAGDFITAPEISQVFGELIGLWCAVVWQQMGMPDRFNLMELGAGRGTLLMDAFRAGRVVPGFRAAASVHIVDANPVLIELQRATLAKAGVTATWHMTLDSLPNDAPSIWVANEFLDTLPVRQLERRDGSWVQRAVGLDDRGRLGMVTAAEDQSLRPIMQSDWTNGDVYEHQPSTAGVLDALSVRAQTTPLAAVLIDYGHTVVGNRDTLQAVCDHKPEDILTSPGEADLSCHVDFEQFASMAARVIMDRPALCVDGPVTQAAFLGELGIVERASRLMAANPARANALETGVARLMAPHGMGTQFKAIGVRSAQLPPLQGLVR